MKTVTLERFEHRGNEQIAIRFGIDDTIRTHLKKLPGVAWSQTHKTFYMPFSAENKALLFTHLRELKVFVDYSALNRKQPEAVANKPTPILLPEITPEMAYEVERFKKWMQEKRLSPNTVATYADVTLLFLRYAYLKNTSHYNARLIANFNFEHIVAQRKSTSYQNQCINGIKKYLQYKGLAVEALQVQRPKKQKKLPQVLSTDEVKSILDATANLKHKTLLSLIYSAGLRIGEAIDLKLADIDQQRMLIHIKQAKGKKDRYTLLSPSFLKLLKEYLASYKPKTYLFEGQNSDQYSSRSAQQVLKEAVSHTQIKKHVTLHTLRHSFATHLLENGTDIRYIQTLLGHNDPKTTMIYTHVSQSSIQRIKNPFDFL